MRSPAPQPCSEQFEHDMELANQFWREFEYRHAFYWQLIYRAVLFFAALTLIPFVAQVHLKATLKFPWIFPCVAQGIGFVIYWVLKSESDRLTRPARLFRERLRLHMTADEIDRYFIVKTGESSSRSTFSLVPSAVISQHLPKVLLACSLIVSFCALSVLLPDGSAAIPILSLVGLCSLLVLFAV